MKYGILVVEGPTDQAVVDRALRLLGFKRFGGQLDALDAFWRSVAKIVPTYPSKSGNLYERVPMPTIMEVSQMSVAIYMGGGSNLIAQVQSLISSHDLDEKLDMFGVVADADDHPAAEVARKYQRAFHGLFPLFPENPGQVVLGPPTLGMFVLPDNTQQGVVEHLVLECGDVVYRSHMQRARDYVGGFNEEARKEAHWTPFDEQKAVIASVASLLKPGKTNTVSLADNLWIGEQTRSCPMLAGLLAFLNTLMGLPPRDGAPSMPPPLVATGATSNST
jgi:hypothetical protein